MLTPLTNKDECQHRVRVKCPPCGGGLAALLKAQCRRVVAPSPQDHFCSTPLCLISTEVDVRVAGPRFDIADRVIVDPEAETSLLALDPVHHLRDGDQVKDGRDEHTARMWPRVCGQHVGSPLRRIPPQPFRCSAPVRSRSCSVEVLTNTLLSATAMQDFATGASDKPELLTWQLCQLTDEPLQSCGL